MPRFFQMIHPLLLLAVLLLHVDLSRRYLSDWKSLESTHPFLSDDHTLHFASANTTVQFLKDSGLNAGFDPAFMSGYVKSSFWPTNALLEAILFAGSGWASPALVFKWFVLLAAPVTALCIPISAALMRFDWAVRFWATAFFTLLYWQRFPFQTFDYLKFGMSAFVWSIGLTLLAGAWISRWLESKTWRATLLAGFFLGLAAMAHPTAVVLLAPPTLLAAVLKGRLVIRRALQILAMSATAVGMNYWWLIPLWIFRGTAGKSPTFFNNPNVIERLIDLFRWDADSGWMWAPNLFALLIVLTFVFGRSRGVFWPAGVLWILLLAIPAGAFQWLGPLQLGRNTLHLAAWLCLSGAAGFVKLWQYTGGWKRGVFLLVAGWWIGDSLPKWTTSVTTIYKISPIASTALMNNSGRRLFESLKALEPPKRILFEVFEDRNAKLSDAKSHFGDYRLAPLIPRQTGAELIGGPYLTTHYHENFANCGDGNIFGQNWSVDRFRRHAGVYALHYAALWSAPAKSVADANEETFQKLGVVFHYSLYRIRRPAEPWETAGLKIEASPNRLRILNPKGAQGDFVLPYHFHAGWKSTPAIRVFGVKRGDDPTPFLAIHDPPEETSLFFSPWEALRQSFGNAD